MARLTLGCLPAIAAMGGAGCILYTEPINVPPTVEILAPTDILYRGSPALFRALASDAEEAPDRLDYRWSLQSASCAGAGSGDEFDHGLDHNQVTIKPGSLGPLCVHLTVTDSNGATTTASRAVTIENHAPEVSVAVDLPARKTATAGTEFALYSSFRLHAKPRDPDQGDVVGLVWTLTDPQGTAFTPPPCADTPDPLSVCFDADHPGTYTVSIAAQDDHGAQAIASPLLLAVAADQPPCLAGLTPALRDVVRDPGLPATFSVAVDDDGDAVPAPTGRMTQATFVWYFRAAPGAALERQAMFNQRTVTLPAAEFRTGDQIDLRVEVRDRVMRDPGAGCSPEDAECALAPGCLQRVTWKVRYL